MFLKLGNELLLNIETIRSINVRKESDKSNHGIVEIQYAGGSGYTRRHQTLDSAKEGFAQIEQVISNNRSIVKLY